MLIPILYLKGVSTGEFEEALAALLGNDAELAIKCFRRRSRQERASGWMHRQRHQRSAVALEPSRQFELEQNHVHSGR